MSAEPTKVLYIAGVPHSGTTVISQILGQLDGVVSVGELYYLSAALENGDRCGCGELVRECPFWTAVLSAAGVSAETLRPTATTWRSGSCRPFSFARVRCRRRPTGARCRPSSGRRRRPGRRASSSTARSPRRWGASSTRRRASISTCSTSYVARPRPATPARASTLATGRSRTPLLWDSWNAAIELLWGRRPARYLRLRYEDFAERPQEAIGAIAALIGENQAASPFSADGTRGDRAHAQRRGQPDAVLDGHDRDQARRRLAHAVSSGRQEDDRAALVAAAPPLRVRRRSLDAALA